jgi:hypothetical protein
MSWLIFNRSTSKLFLIGGKLPSGSGGVYTTLGSWTAHNNTASLSGGHWPSGTYRWQRYKPHTEVGLSPGCYATAYGCNGIHIFEVSDRSGMGVHSGRTFDAAALGGKTLGCIRTTDQAMQEIDRIHAMDSLEGIVVSD